MEAFRLVLILLLLSATSACKLTVVVPEGGEVISRTGTNDCGEAQTCVIDIPDGTTFSDTFTARPSEGYYFAGWTRQPGYVCGKKSGACSLENISPEFTSLDVEIFLAPIFQPGGLPLTTEDTQMKRDVDHLEHLSLLYPGHWVNNGSGAGVSGARNMYYEKRQWQFVGEEYDDDQAPVQVFLYRLPEGEQFVLPRVEVNRTVLGREPRTVAGFEGEAVRYELEFTYEFDQPFFAHDVYYEFDGTRTGLFFWGEQSSYVRNEQLFDAMVSSLVAGQPVFEDLDVDSDLSTPGKPGIATDGDRTLYVTCREDPGFDEVKLVGRMVNSDRTMGEEFSIRSVGARYDCNSTSHRLVYTGSEYLLFYLDQIREGSSLLFQVSAERFSRDGSPLTTSPILVYRASQGEMLQSLAVDYRDGRALLAWEKSLTRTLLGDDPMDSVMAAYVGSDGAVGQPIVVADALKHLDGSFSGIDTDVKVISSETGSLVAWVASTQSCNQISACVMSLYVQALDASGNPLTQASTLIRSDNGNDPRDLALAFNGENYVVGWIESAFTTQVYGSRYDQVRAVLVSPIGALVSEAPVLISEEDAASGPDNSASQKRFLDLSFDGNELTFSYGQGAVFAVVASPDLEEISEQYSLSTPRDEQRYIRNRRSATQLLAGAHSSMTWTTTDMVSWYFDEEAGIASLDPEPPENLQPQPNQATAGLDADAVPRLTATLFDTMSLGEIATYLTRIFSVETYTPEVTVGSCSERGRIYAQIPLPGEVARVRLQGCSPAEGMFINGEIRAVAASKTSDYRQSIELVTSELLIARGDITERFSGKMTTTQSQIELIDKSVLFDGEFTFPDGSRLELDQFSYSFVEDRGDILEYYGFDGDILVSGGSLQLEDAGDSTLVVRGANGNRALLRHEELQTEALFEPAGSAGPTRGVRLRNVNIADGEITFLSDANNAPLVADYPIATPADGRQGTGYPFNVLGLHVDLEGDTLTYDVAVTQVQKVGQYGASFDELVESPNYTVSQTGVADFTLEPFDAGIYTLAVTATDLDGEVSSPREIRIRIELDSDFDGILDEDDPDDDNDGIMDFQEGN